MDLVNMQKSATIGEPLDEERCRQRVIAYLENNLKHKKPPAGWQQASEGKVYSHPEPSL